MGSALPMTLPAAFGRYGLGPQPGTEEEAVALGGQLRRHGEIPRQTSSGEASSRISGSRIHQQSL